MNAFYIKDYIDFFKLCEIFFIKGEIANFNDSKKEILKNIGISVSPDNYSLNSKKSSIHSKSSTKILPSGRFRKTAKKKTNKIIKDKISEDRVSIVSQILEFHQEHSMGLNLVVENILKVYSDLIIQSNSWSKQYEETSALVSI